MRTILSGLLVLLLLGGCKKENPTTVLDPIPSIRLVSISSNSLQQFVDSFSIRIEYEDGDGDLGYADPDINSLFIRDNRLDVADEYYVQLLAPEGANVSIRGELNIQLQSPFIFGNGNEEKTKFILQLVDRAGNMSNTIETEEISIFR